MASRRAGVEAACAEPPRPRRRPRVDPGPMPHLLHPRWRWGAAAGRAGRRPPAAATRLASRPRLTRGVCCPRAGDGCQHQGGARPHRLRVQHQEDHGGHEAGGGRQGPPRAGGGGERPPLRREPGQGGCWPRWCLLFLAVFLPCWALQSCKGAGGSGCTSRCVVWASGAARPGKRARSAAGCGHKQRAAQQSSLLQDNAGAARSMLAAGRSSSGVDGAI